MKAVKLVYGLKKYRRVTCVATILRAERYEGELTVRRP